MIIYRVAFTKSAEKDLYRLPRQILDRALPAIAALAEVPRPAGCKKLKGHDNLWRIGDYRILYAIEDVILLVDIRAVGHRSSIYQ